MRLIPILVRSVVWLGLLGLSAWCWQAADRSLGMAPAQLQIPAREDFVYRTVGRRQATLDVYTPRDPVSGTGFKTRRPAILAIHGGSWSGGSKRLFRSPPRNDTIRRLTQAGYVVIAMDYRLARPGSPGWPEALDDVREAVRWARSHAEELGIDTGRIVALGQSAGAHLALLLGTCPDPADATGVSSRVGAVVSLYGPSDLNHLAESRGDFGHDPTRIFVGGENLDFVERAMHASPVTFVSRDDAPTLLIHGTNDLWVPIDQSKNLSKSFDNSGVTHQLIIVDGAAHGFESESQHRPETRSSTRNDCLLRICMESSV